MAFKKKHVTKSAPPPPKGKQMPPAAMNAMQAAMGKRRGIGRMASMAGIILLALLPSLVLAEYRDIELAARTDAATNTIVVTNMAPFDGCIEFLLIDMLTAASTCDVTVAVQPRLSLLDTTQTSFTLFSKTGMTADGLYFLTTPMTISGNTTATNSTLRGFPLGARDNIVLTLSNGVSTGRVWRAILRISRR